MRQEIEMVFGRRFWLSVAIMLICFSGYAALEWIAVGNWPVEVRPSSLQQTIGGIFFGGVMLLMPLCASLSSGLLQVEELQCAFVDLRIIKSSVHKYIVQKFTASFLCGATSVGLAFSIHAIIWNIVATPCNPIVNSYTAIPFANNCIYYSWEAFCYGLPIYLWMLLWISFCGGMWSFVGITAAMYIPDKIIAIAVPFCIYYLWHCGFPQALLNLKWFPHPADLYNDALTWDVVGISLMVYALLGLTCLALYSIRIQRRYKHEK
ncbi:MAG: hypothetical protein RSE58_07000 [Clostridia bacterium]